MQRAPLRGPSLPLSAEQGGEFKAGDADMEMTQLEARPPTTTASSGPEEAEQGAAARPPVQPELNYRGMTISMAAAKGDLPHVVLLFGMAGPKQMNPMRPDVEGNNPLHYAALAETPEVATFIMQTTRGVVGPGLPLLHLRNADGETPLLRAAGAGHVPTIKFLLESGSQLLVTDHGNGNTVLHNAARNGHLWALVYLLETAARAGLSEDAIAKFLEVPDKEDHTCLEWACFQGHLPVVTHLIRKHGMDPNRTDHKGRTCLHLAARQLHAPVVRFLVQQMKMDAGQKDSDGRDAYWYAKGDRDVVDALRGPVIKKKRKDGAAKDEKRQQELEQEEEGQKKEPVAEEDKDSLRKPLRRNPPRLRMVLSYVSLTTTLWLLPFFLAWYAYLPLLVAATCAYRRMFISYTRLYDTNKPDQPPRKMTWLAQWVTAHESFMGFWAGTFLACVLTYPVLSQWPSSASWSMQQEMASAALRGVARVAGPRVTPVLIAVFYSAMAMAIALWADLIWLRPDPGTLRFNDQHFQDITAQVASSGVPPPVNQVCYTCAIKRPLRSKHCGTCGFCIPRMDHHCVWLDNCVGLHNHGRFLSFVTLHVLCCAIYVTFALCLLRDAVLQELQANGSSDACQVVRVLFLRPVFPLLCLSTFSLLCAAGLLFLLADQLNNLARNMTTNEKINFNRYPWLVTPEGRFLNRFHRGVVRNVLEFVGHKTYRRDYTAVYDLPPLSECVQRRPSTSCKDGRCCPPPPGPAPSSPPDDTTTDQTRSPLRPRHSDPHAHAEQGGAARGPAACHAGQGCCHEDAEQASAPGGREQEQAGHQEEEAEQQQQVVQQQGGGDAIQVQAEAGREGTMV